ncbi:hypothetical protein G4Y79_23740 [Phototrophicus methaneseepsis]|uniref:Uncharacterized protein n=1 Tax=Phototrophicus methaneseepsis TaxID=2710758 RepID=A0A7S8IF82_9CHLR|nr:hypothetical protein [Phototrophicus methaneseepsis]QPC82663.1 hypothetical protein G4Y79_23740 [Phototrophicus methaneseepsis]
MAAERTGYFKSSWLQEKRIAYIELIGKFDEQLVIDVNEHMRSLIDEGMRPVHLVLDATGLTGYPVNVRVLKQSSEASASHPDVGWLILIGFTNPVIKFFSSVLAQLFNLNFKQAESTEEAVSILRRVDITIETPAE